MINPLPILAILMIGYIIKLTTKVDKFFIFSYLLFYATLFAIFMLSINIAGLPAFSSGDASYYQFGGESVYKAVVAGSNLYEALFSFTWEPKYWGFIYLNYLAYDLFPNSTMVQSLILKLCNFLVWSVFIFHSLRYVASFSLEKNRMLFALILMSLFPIFLNYRDIFVSVFFYFFCYFMFVRKNYFFALLFIIFMYFFRREMIPLMLVGSVFSYLSYYIHKKYFKFNLIAYSIFSFSICFMLVYLIGHDRFSLTSLAKLPLSMMGTSPFQILALYFDGESYYQGRIFNHISHLVFSLAWVYLFYSFIKLTVRKVAGNDLTLLPIYFTIFIFIFNVVAYTLINDGFQERVKVGVISLFVFLYMPKSNFSLISFFVSAILFMLVAFRNLRWVL